MKKKVILLSTALCILFANENADITFAKKIPREFPTSKESLLSYNNILEGARSSVVNISTQKSISNRVYANPFMNDPFFREFFRGFDHGNIPQERIERSLGSGVVISKNGYIVTNNHVIDGADKVIVTLAGDKKEYEAKVIGKDAKSDIAIIKIESKGLKPITLYDSDDVKVGDIVFAIGNPFGVGETVTQGIVSATRRDSVGIVEYEDFIQTDAPINPGNSGGALINSAGYLVGINSAIISKGGGNVGIGFAIPSNMVSRIAQQLIDKGEFKRAYLGVGIADVNEEMSSFYDGNYGALITTIEEHTPAHKAGLKRGDLILSVDGKEISSASELKNRIGTYAPDSQITLEILREKKRQKITLTLTAQGSGSSFGEYHYNGLTLSNISLALQKEYAIASGIEGVVITNRDDNSKAQTSGIQPGDVIIQVENSEIKNLKDFEKATLKSGKKRIYIYRRGGIFVIAL